MNVSVPQKQQLGITLKMERALQKLREGYRTAYKREEGNKEGDCMEEG